VPSNPWVAVGWRKRAETGFSLKGPLQKKGINFIHSAVIAIKPDDNQLQLENGDTLDYDYLVIATGPALSWLEQYRARPVSALPTNSRPLWIPIYASAESATAYR